MHKLDIPLGPELLILWKDNRELLDTLSLLLGKPGYTKVAELTDGKCLVKLPANAMQVVQRRADRLHCSLEVAMNELGRRRLGALYAKVLERGVPHA